MNSDLTLLLNSVIFKILTLFEGQKEEDFLSAISFHGIQDWARAEPGPGTSTWLSVLLYCLAGLCYQEAGIGNSQDSNPGIPVWERCWQSGTLTVMTGLKAHS